MAITPAGLTVPDHVVDLAGGVNNTGATAPILDEADAVVKAPDKPYDMKSETEASAGKYASQLPVPRGFTILIMLPVISETSDGGVYIGEDEIRAQEVSSVCGYVMAMGEDCYQDLRKFPAGRWCDPGDWVMFKAYSGTRFKVQGREFRLINDTSVQATVDDPRGISKLL